MAVHHDRKDPVGAATSWGPAPKKETEWTGRRNPQRRPSPINEAIGTPPPSYTKAAAEPETPSDIPPADDDGFITVKIPKAVLYRIVEDILMNDKTKSNPETTHDVPNAEATIEQPSATNTNTNNEENTMHDNANTQSQTPKESVAAAPANKGPWFSKRTLRVIGGTVAAAAVAAGGYVLYKKYGLRLTGSASE